MTSKEIDEFYKKVIPLWGIPKEFLFPTDIIPLNEETLVALGVAVKREALEELLEEFYNMREEIRNAKNK
jgi:hypothetical protein